MAVYTSLMATWKPGIWGGALAVHGLEVLCLFRYCIINLLAVAIKCLAEAFSAGGECILLRYVGLALPRPCRPSDRSHVFGHLLIPRRQGSAQQLTILVGGVAVSLGVLGYFKYYNFFADSFAALVHTSRINAALLLPVGISFYTFHSISYMLDTYRRKIEPTRSIVDVSLYILLFPQLVAGPIVRATDLLPQMRSARRISSPDIKYFLAMFLIGYFKKAVVSR
jgi:hypothetical protein